MILYRFGSIFIWLLGSLAWADVADESAAPLSIHITMFEKLFIGDNPYGGARPALGTVREQMREIRNDRLQTPDHRYWASSFYARELWNDGLMDELAVECRSVPPRDFDFSYQSLCILVGGESLANKIAAVEALADQAYAEAPRLVSAMNILSMLGDYLTFNGRPVESLRIYRKAFELCPEHDKTALIMAKSNLALAYLNPLFPMDVQKLGLHYYDDVIAYHKENAVQGWQTQNLGWTSYNKGIALTFNFRAYQEALVAFKAAEGIHILEIDNAIFQAYALVHLKRYDEARAILDRTDTLEVVDPRRRQFLSCYKELSYRLMGDSNPIPHCLELDNPQHDVLLDLTAQIMTSQLSIAEENTMWRKFYQYFDQKIKPDVQEYLAAATDQAELARMRANEKFKDLELKNLSLYKKYTLMASIAAGLLLAMAIVLFRFWQLQRRNSRLMEEEKHHLQGILDGIEEGLVMITPGLVLKPEQSSHLDAILGAFDLALKPLHELLKLTDLSPEEQAHTAACLEASLGESPLTFELNHPHLPAEWRIQSRIIACYWQPIVRDEQLTGIILVMRDVTALREREQERSTALAASNAILTLSQEIFRGHPKAAQQFLSNLGNDLDELERLFTHEKNPNRAMQLAHTIKGTARTLELKSLQEAAHQFESRLRSGGMILDSQEFQLLRETAEAYTNALSKLVLGPEQEISSLWEVIGVLRKSLKAQLEAAGLELQGIDLCERVELTSDELKVVHELLLHALTNAADHGYILPAKRGVHVGAALFEIELSLDSGFKKLCLRDNGVGVNREQVEAKARTRGWQVSPGRDWTDFLFEDGVTTAEELSSTSGRGVGLPAIKAAARRMLGDVRIRNIPDQRGTEITIQWPQDWSTDIAC